MAYIGKSPATVALAASDITDGIVSNAKLAQDIISGDTALGATPADTDEFLVSDAGTLKRVDYSYIKGGGSWNLIKTLTSDGSDSDLSFVDGTSDVTLDSTYSHYVFIFINMHPEENDRFLTFQANAAGGSGYNETIISTAFRSEHYENDTATGLAYHTASDQNGTAAQRLDAGEGVGNDNDQSISGELHLFNPSSTTYAKNWYSINQKYTASDISALSFTSGYINTASAIDEIQFKFTSGEIQGGIIKLYGIS